MTKKSKNNSGKFRGYFPGPHGIYYKTSPQAHEQREAERRAKEQAKRERFRQSYEKGRRFLSTKKILEHWLKQIEIALAGPKKYWGDTKKYSWPKDKAIIYAVMMICIENTGSVVKLIPDSLQQTKQYKFNEYVWTWVENFDLAVELMNYIEADLKKEKLLPSKFDTETPDKTNSSAAMSRPLGLKKWAKILDVSINKARDWKNDSKSKYHFKEISARKWSLPLNELPAEYLVKYQESLS